MDFLTTADIVLPKLFVIFIFFTLIYVSFRGFANKNKEADWTPAQKDAARAKELKKELEAQKED